jgi:hypothetical protein
VKRKRRSRRRRRRRMMIMIMITMMMLIMGALLVPRATGKETTVLGVKPFPVPYCSLSTLDGLP